MNKISLSDLTSKRHQTRKAFTLIEVLVASLILSSVFFAVLKLIANNSHQAINLEHSKTMDELFLSSKTCLESFEYETLSWMINTTGAINFGANNLDCLTGIYNADLSFTWISLERQTGTGSDTETGTITYWSSFLVRDNTGSLKVSTTITDGTEKKEYDFIVGK